MESGKGHDEDYFDEDFYRGGGKGAVRDKDSPFYRMYASRVLSCIGGKEYKILDVGCGMGIRTMHYVTAGEAVVGFDVSKWAYESTVLPEGRHVLGDVRKINTYFLYRAFDVVNVERVMAYLPEEDARETVGRVVEVASKYVIFSIICSDHGDGKAAKRGAPGRLNINTKQYWEELFVEVDLTLNEEYTKRMRAQGWDCIWFLERH